MTAFTVASGEAYPTGGGSALKGSVAGLKALAFQQQPQGGTTALPLPTQPIVRALTEDGALDVAFSGSITLTLVGVGVLTGTVTVAASGGIATFTDLIITGIGSCQLRADAAGYVSATSSTVTTV